MAPELTETTIQDIYAALVDNAPRNEMIVGDMVRAVESGRCPLLLTGRTEHLQCVQVYDYVDGYVLMLARMYERRLKGYAAIGYAIEQKTIPPHPPAAARA
jgi:hypothetical protein